VGAHAGEGTREGFHRGEVGFPVGLGLQDPSVRAACALKPFQYAFEVESVVARAKA
jgi:hypothetical protein